MSRRRAASKRRLFPEARYNHLVMAKLINVVMCAGKKATAEGIVYEAIESAAERLGVSPVELLEKAMQNITPLLEVRARRVGGATYQVPTEVRPERRLTLALRWLVDSARARKAEKTMVKRLMAELLDAYANRGPAVKKKEDVHKMAEANRAFAHYRW